MTPPATANHNATPPENASRAETLATSNKTVGATVVCDHCSSPNPQERKFCSECGTTLWDKCPACRAECASGDTYCGSCGINVKELLAEATAQIKTALVRAAECEAEHRLDEALRELRRVKLVDDHRLEKLAAEVRHQIDRLTQKNASQRETLATGIERVKALIKSHEYDEALRLLGKLPPALQSEESQTLIRTAKDRRREIAALSREIVTAVKNNEFLDLAPKFSRLLMLKPGSKSVVQLAERVRDRLARLAQKQLQAFEYRRAVDLLGRIPGCAENDQVRRLRRRATEVACIYDDLRFSPVIDEAVVKIAGKISGKLKGDQKLVALCNKIARLAQQTADDPRFPAVPWISPPRRTLLGTSVRWLGGSRRLGIADAARHMWKQTPGCYFVAAGLALQGVGECNIATNLADEKASLLGKLSLRRREKTRVAWGIDIGESSLKAVRIVATEGAEPLLDRCASIRHRLPLNRPSATTSYATLLTESLTALQEREPLEKHERICARLPAHRVLARLLTVPDAPAKKLTGMIEYEASQQIPIPLTELAHSYHLFDAKVDDPDDGAMREVLFLAMKKQLLDEVSRAFDDAELRVDVFQSEAAALHNFARFEGLDDLLPEISAANKYLALLDVGTEASNLVILSQNRVWLRNLRVGGDDFTQAAVRRLHLTFDQAEQLKHNPAAAPSISELYEAFEPAYDRLTSEIRRSLQMFAAETQGEVVAMLGCGGGFCLHGLMRYLRSGPA